MNERTSDTTLVVAAVIRKNDKILLSSRPQGRKYHGFWEFPGGKIAPEDETPQSALKRELKEELNADALPLDIIFQNDFFDKSPIKIFFIRTFLKNTDDLHCKEGQEFRWLSLNQLTHYRILPADIALIKFLYPYCYVKLAKI